MSFTADGKRELTHEEMVFADKTFHAMVASGAFTSNTVEQLWEIAVKSAVYCIQNYHE